MKRTFKLLAFILIVSFRQTTLAQLSEPGYPASISLGLNSENIHRLLLPTINSDSILAADTCQSCADLYGFDIEYQTDFWDACSRDLVDLNGSQLGIYRLLVSQPTAEGLHVIFDRFKLADDETMFIYGLNDTSRILGAYSHTNNRANNTFTSNIIHGGDIVIEVNKKNPTDFDHRGHLGISKFIYVFESRLHFESTDFDCYTNVICAPWYNEWYNEIRSVVKIMFRFEDGRRGLCSGAILNSTRTNFDPLILTAEHCVDGKTDPASWSVFFNFQSNLCDPDVNVNDLMMLSGIDIIATSSGLGCKDIALMRVQEEIPIQYNVFFSGWTSLDPTYPQDGTVIHHPSGDIKKISEGEIKNSITTSCHKVNWTHSVSEPGSSGAPLYTNGRLIVGVNSKGASNKSCDNTKYNLFSKVKNSFNALQPHLSPNEDNVVALFGIDPISSCQSEININGRVFPSRDWQINEQLTIQAEDLIRVANLRPTSIENSPLQHNNNSDYVIRAGNRITINPGFRINRPYRSPGTPSYASFFPEGNQNRVSFQIALCEPFTDDCGFNHENAFVIPKAGGIRGSDRYLENDLVVEFSLKIYPNPTNGTNNVTIEYSKEIAKVSILNNIGQTIFEEVLNADANSSKLDINDLDAGIYFVLVLDRDAKMQFKKLSVN